MHLSRILASLCLAVSLATLFPVNGDIIIDDFTTGPLHMTSESYANGAKLLQTDLQPGGPIGGTREVFYAGGTFSIETNQGRIRADSNENFGYIDLRYGTESDLNVDLTDGGINDRFLISFFDVSDGLWRSLFSIWVKSGINTGQANFSQDFFAISSGPNTYGSVSIPFTSFDEVDFTQIDQITLRIGRIEPSSGFSISSIAVIPEPTAMALLAIGIPLTQRRRQAA